MGTFQCKRNQGNRFKTAKTGRDIWQVFRTPPIECEDFLPLLKRGKNMKKYCFLLISSQWLKQSVKKRFFCFFKMMRLKSGKWTDPKCKGWKNRKSKFCKKTVFSEILSTFSVICKAFFQKVNKILFGFRSEIRCKMKKIFIFFMFF